MKEWNSGTGRSGKVMQYVPCYWFPSNSQGEINPGKMPVDRAGVCDHCVLLLGDSHDTVVLDTHMKIS